MMKEKYYFVNVDYVEFKPETYSGVEAYLDNVLSAKVFAGDFEADLEYLTEQLLAKGGYNVVYSSSVDHYRMDVKSNEPAPIGSYTVNEAADMIGVTAATLRIWERKGYITSNRTLGGHRRYTEDAINEIKQKMRGE